MRNSLKAVALAYLGLVAALQESVYSIQDEDYQENDVITRDVCVVGGGSGGTYAATRLRQLGQSVVVIEKESLLGGHTNTYTDPTSGQTIDYGVVVFHNISVVQNYFSYYNVTLGPTGFPSPNTTEYIDFRTGNTVENYTYPNPIASLSIWATQLAKYPFLVTGINLPDPVPADLLLPFRDFVLKYNLTDLVQTISQLGQGYADLIDQPTIYAIKLFGPSLLQTVETGYVASADHNNHAIYDAATVELTAANSLLLSSHILFVKRNCDSGGTTKIVVRTPSGPKLIKAKKIVVAIPPRISNFNGWDLDQQETEVFSTYSNEAYYTGLITNTGLPDSFEAFNVGAGTEFNLPSLPVLYRFSPTTQPGLIDVKYASTFEQDDEVVKATILTELGNLKIPGVKPTPWKVKWAAWSAHVPFFEKVTTEQIAGGFYRRASALQGHRGVWYTGAAWESHDSSMIWNFTETLLPAIVQA